MENGAIADGQITASSIWNAGHESYRARLHLQGSQGSVGGWIAGVKDSNQWLQVDLGNQYTKVTRIATQGRNYCCLQWVTRYKLEYSDDEVTFQYFNDEQGQAKVLREIHCILSFTW